MLTVEQKEFFRINGYVRVPQVFTRDEMAVLSEELDRVIQDWAVTNMGWTGPWRQVYLLENIEHRSQLTHINDFHIHSAAWLRAVTYPRLTEALADFLGPCVELHHSTLHCKPPETGMPFPLHQDSPFFQHEGFGFIDAIVHVDAGTEENGCLRFLPGSHAQGHLTHITQMPDGTPCSPHLPTDRYRLTETTACPAEAGDVVLFSIYTIHGSDINRSDRWRRLVRLGYRDPRCRQIGGHALGRPGLMARGVRPVIPQEES